MSAAAVSTIRAFRESMKNVEHSFSTPCNLEAGLARLGRHETSGANSKGIAGTFAVVSARPQRLVPSPGLLRPPPTPLRPTLVLAATSR